jgi:hypothetical protein
VQRVNRFFSPSRFFLCGRTARLERDDQGVINYQDSLSTPCFPSTFWPRFRDPSASGGGLYPATLTPSNPFFKKSKLFRRKAEISRKNAGFLTLGVRSWLLKGTNGFQALSAWDEKGTRCGVPIRGQDRGCPRNCKRMAGAHKPLGTFPREGDANSRYPQARRPAAGTFGLKRLAFARWFDPTPGTASGVPLVPLRSMSAGPRLVLLKIPASL